MADACRPDPGGLYLGPVRRPLNSDSEFFDDGNTNRALLCKINVFAIITGGAECMDFHEHQQQTFECMFKGCNATFSSLKRHEAHYETSHRNRCCTCGRSFPTHRLLDIHLSEAHDSFFMAMAERRPMYACLVEGCSEVFESPGKRHEHLVGAHLYPESFDFSRPSYTRRKAKIQKSKDGGKRGKNLDLEPTAGRGRKGNLSSRVARVDANNEASLVATQREESCLLHSAFTPADEGSRSNCQNQVAPRPVLGTTAAAASRRTCKFWRTAAGCRAGSDCKFKHAARGGDESKELKMEAEAMVGVEAASSVLGVGGGGGAREQSRLGNGGVHGGVGVGLDSGSAENDIGGGSAKGNMEVDGDTSGGVEELISGMSKLLIPRHLGFGRSARRGEPVV